jgi:hypothetical protein
MEDFTAKWAMCQEFKGKMELSAPAGKISGSQ